MIRCTCVRPKTDSISQSPGDTITLDEIGRHQRRRQLTSDGGVRFLLDLPTAVRLCDGDRLVLDDQRVIRVCAALEPLFEVHAACPRHLLQLAWHLGNRHQPTEIRLDHLRIRQDPVIRTMLERLGATVQPVEERFQPEGGAYGDASSSRK